MIPRRNQEFMGKTGQNVRTIQIIQIMTSPLQKVCIQKKDLVRIYKKRKIYTYNFIQTKLGICYCLMTTGFPAGSC